jgi:hypothetical protein
MPEPFKRASTTSLLTRMMQKPDHVRITGQNFTFELAKDI